jgi:hypothetical protein
MNTLPHWVSSAAGWDGIRIAEQEEEGLPGFVEGVKALLNVPVGD